MKRTLRSRNSCTAIQNVFEKQTQSEFSELIELIPLQILKKLSKKKTILCQDLINFELNIKPSQNQLQRIKIASKILKEKCERGLFKTRKTEDKSTANNSSYFDCLINEQEIGRKMVKCEPFPIDFQQVHKTNFEYKIEFNDCVQYPTPGNGENFLKLNNRRMNTISEEKQAVGLTEKSIKEPQINF